ncbi:alpha,alpha-trehalase [Malassezia cuniculi]|uniref:Trehalase n=1 Tax=Malassezia cuniculi TaxID=948313 RepID=A0AAF0EYA7_9BASI|nr:alpha,alpha-trehalase [Malassezia cuniculi]
MASHELAATYASLILADEGVEITSDKIVQLTTAAGVPVEPIWAQLLSKALEGKDIKELLFNIGAGSGPAAAAAPAAAAGGDAPAAEAKEEKEEEKKEESDDDAKQPPTMDTVFESDDEGTSVAPIQRMGVKRTYSMQQQKRRPLRMNEEMISTPRRLSGDMTSLVRPDRQLIVDVESTIQTILDQEDTDGDKHISINDSGPKAVTLGTVESSGYRGIEVRGTYRLSTLLQELALAREAGEKRVILTESRLTESPVDRLSRMIRTVFWDNLTRRIDADGLEKILLDTKNRSASTDPIIYVPAAEKNMIEYYKRVSTERPALRLQVKVLPEDITPEYVRDLYECPGLLALAMRERYDPKTGLIDMEGIPFTVPGARFNELYNWDSYFIALGLIIDGRIDLAKGPVEHFIFEIKHYGKILNGNRTYYLTRSQPPFLTDFALRVYEAMAPAADDPNAEKVRADNVEWLRAAMRAAIKEYHTVWMAEPRYDPETGLSRYRPVGLGVPPETEASHFTSLLRPYAEKYGCSINEFTRKYNRQQVHEPELDEYFMHDRGVRESGHDTSYRLERRCADLATIDLQALLYKYEMDIGETIRDVFGGELTLEEEFELSPPFGESVRRSSLDAPQTPDEWFARAAFRRSQVDRYCWNEGMGLYYDYDTRLHEQSLYETATSFWALWAGMASQHQAETMVRKSLHKFEVTGGIVPGTEESRGPISLARPNRQWDYPFAWPPHQIPTWYGLKRYGFESDAQRLAYRWLYLMTTAFVDFNGVVPEKFDAVKLSHLVNAEYGNQGTDYAYVPREGFGWMNASFQVGLTFVTDHMRRAIASCQHPDDFFKLRKQ